MFKNLLRITVSIGLMIFANVSRAETPSVKELSKGITAFLCTEVNKLENVPYIFIEGKDGWSLNGTPDISVSKTDNGFMLKFPSPFEGIGVFNEDKDKDGSWKFEYLGEGGSLKSTCTIQNDFAFILTTVLIPKIVKNADELVEAKNKARDALLSEKYLSQRLQTKLDEALEELKATQSHRDALLSEKYLSQRLQTKLDEALEELKATQSQIANLKARKPILAFKPEILRKLVLNIRQCWNVPVGLENDSSNVIIMGIKLGIDGNLEEDPVNLSPNSGVGMIQAYEAARRAVLRCQPYKLPADAYEYWREMEIELDPSEMVVK